MCGGESPHEVTRKLKLHRN